MSPKRKSVVPAEPSPKPKRRQSLSAVSAKKRARDEDDFDQTIEKLKRSYKKKDKQLDNTPGVAKTPAKNVSFSASVEKSTPRYEQTIDSKSSTPISDSKLKKAQLEQSVKRSPVPIHQALSSQGSTTSTTNYSSNVSTTPLNSLFEPVPVPNQHVPHHENKHNNQHQHQHQHDDKLYDEKEILHVWDHVFTALNAGLSSIIPVFLATLLLSWLYKHHSFHTASAVAGATVTYSMLLLLALGPYFIAIVPFILISRMFTRSVNLHHNEMDHHQQQHQHHQGLNVNFICRVTTLIVVILISLTLFEFSSM